MRLLQLRNSLIIAAILSTAFAPSGAQAGTVCNWKPVDYLKSLFDHQKGNAYLDRLNRTHYEEKELTGFLEHLKDRDIPLDQIKKEGRELVYRRQKALQFKGDQDIAIQSKVPFQVKNTNTEIDLMSSAVVEQNYLKRDVKRMMEKRDEALDVKTTASQDTVAVVGGGPLGLVSGIRAFKEGKTVVILEKRGGYFRDQIMGLDPHFMSWFREDAPDLEHLMQGLGIFEKRPGWVDLGNPEPFDSIRIQQLENSLGHYVNELEKASNGKIKVIRDTELVDQATTENGYSLTAKTGDHFENINANYVVGVDGGQGSSKAIFGLQDFTTTDGHWSGPAVFTGSPEQAFLFKTKYSGKSLRPLFLENPKRVEILKKLQALGWPNEQYPAVRIFQNGDIFYLGTEVPPALGSRMAKDKILRDEWYSAVKELTFPEKITGPLKIADGPLATAAFPVELRRVTDFAKVNKQAKKIGSAYFAVGDNAAGPHFMTRSGINSGFHHTDALEDFFFTTNYRTNIPQAVETYKHAVEDETDHLFAKPVGNKFLKDGPFNRVLNANEDQVAKKLRNLGVKQVSFTNMIAPLMKAGVDPAKPETMKILEETVNQMEAVNQPERVVEEVQSRMSDYHAHLHDLHPQSKVHPLKNEEHPW